MNIQIHSGKAIKSDNKADGIQILFLQKYNAEVTAKDTAVCPDGKEKSLGIGINIFTFLTTLQGRILATKGFNKPLQSRTSKIIANATTIPAFRVLGIIIKAISKTIHTKPPLPNELIKGISTSPIGVRRVCI